MKTITTLLIALSIYTLTISSINGQPDFNKQTGGQDPETDLVQLMYYGYVGDTVSTQFGSAVSYAGDVNNDGMGDLLIGAVETNSFKGKAKLYAGGGFAPLSIVAVNGENVNDKFGSALSTLRDINHDDYDDIIVGAPGYNSGRGRVYIYYGGLFMDSAVDKRMTAPSAGEGYGSSVSVCDFNNDGFPDIIVGAPNANSNAGKCYIYFGGMEVDTVADIVMVGETSGSNFGISVSGARDVNGDGFEDVIVGASGYSGSTGRAYIYYGGTNPDNTADVIMTGSNPLSYFGCSVSWAGDVNGDFYKDVIVGEKGYFANRGRINIFFGAAAMNNTADFKTIVKDTSKLLGYSVSGLCDVNEDGYDDIIAGAPGYASDKGQSYILFGGAQMDTIPDFIFTGESPGDRCGNSVSGGGTMNFVKGPDALIGYPGMQFLAWHGAAYLTSELSVPATSSLGGNTIVGPNLMGYSVSDAGDVNNDGYADVIAGSPGSGKSFIYYGGVYFDSIPDVSMNSPIGGSGFGVSVSSAGDVNGDGFDDVIVGSIPGSGNAVFIYYGGSPMDKVPDVSLSVPASALGFGSAVSGAGDINNDGYNDVIVSAPLYSMATGRVYVYYGGSSMNNGIDLTLTGEQSQSRFGRSVSSAGDFNNDGYDDLIIGSPKFNTNRGRIYIYLGGSTPNNVADLKVTGDSVNRNLGMSVSDAGDFNGDGIADVIAGASDTFTNGKAYLFTGSNSIDTVADLVFLGKFLEGLGFSVSGGGDLNNDGYDDVMIGCPGNIPAIRFYNGGPAMDNSDDYLGFYLPDGAFRNVGYSISKAGDVNNDGFDDVIHGIQNTNSNNGEAYLFQPSKSIKPYLYFVKDVPNDNGNKVKMVWIAGDRDEITSYVIERSTDPLNGGLNWIPVKTVAKTLNPIYSDTLTTPDNSIYYYRVVAKTNDPSIFWNSTHQECQSFDNSLSINLSFKTFIEGFYNSGSDSQTGDTAIIFLQNSTAPYSTADSAKVYIGSNGMATANFTNAAAGSYYIVMKHRNAITTWSSAPAGLLYNVTNNYDFTVAANKAFGDNQKNVDTSPVAYALFSGDVNQDEAVDVTDIIIVFNDANAFASGYVATDLTGDSFVDVTDLTVAFNNSNTFVTVVKP